MVKAEELEKLKELNDNGIITEEEFKSEKQKILNEPNTKQKDTSKKWYKKSKTWLIVLGVSLVIFVILLISWLVTSKKYDDLWEQHFKADYEQTNYRYL